MVAGEVEVRTRSAVGGEGVIWRSSGEDAYTIEAADDLPRGTQVVLHLQDDALEFAEDFRLRSIVRKYSDHIGVPVRMVKAELPTTEEDEQNTDKESADAELEAVNSAKALWTRSRLKWKTMSTKSFISMCPMTLKNLLHWSHNKVEGKLEYTSLLYLPKRAPFDLYNREAPKGLKLYVQRVFIMDDAEQFLPLYLRFVKGVIDSNDLPLNVSREILQQDERVTSIRNAVTKRVLTMLGDMAKKNLSNIRSFGTNLEKFLKKVRARILAIARAWQSCCALPRPRAMMAPRRR